MTEFEKNNIENEIFEALQYINDTKIVGLRLAARLTVKRFWQQLYPNDDGWKSLIS